MATSAVNRLRIGFVGATGLMGHGMAKNLAKKGFPRTLLARPARRDRLADILEIPGASEAATSAEVARRSDVVLLCVTGSTEVEEIIFGEGGVASAARKGLIVVDCSTSEVASSTKTRELLAKKGVLFVDAPLTRTPAAAEAGTANTMVGADDATFRELQPVFQAYCEHIIHAGPPGHGLVLKLINNFVGQAITTATAEGLATAAKTGLDIRAMHKLMSLGSVNNLMFQFMVGTMLEGGPARLEGLKFSLGNAMKDLRAYTHLTESLCIASPVGEAVHQSLVQANAMGLGDKYIASLITAQEKLCNVVIDKEGAAEAAKASRK
jgi:3-hydroxyisobutyrate dehydrogenase-like beta-hydroxyacid dehydrogenase